jgi:hypothetical protein
MIVSGSAVEQKNLSAVQNDVTKKLRLVALAVPALTLMASSIVIRNQPQLGFLAAALIFGWTQLVGL